VKKCLITILITLQVINLRLSIYRHFTAFLEAVSSDDHHHEILGLRIYLIMPEIEDKKLKHEKALRYILDYLKQHGRISFGNTIGLCRDYRKDIDPSIVAEILKTMDRDGWFIPDSDFPSGPYQKLSSYGEEQLNHDRPVLAPPKRLGRLIEVKTLPDDFYIKLVDEINILYGNNLPVPLCILVRKLLENLVIDILRKRYGMPDASVFFNVSEGRFYTFSKLLKNLSDRKSDFSQYTSNLDEILTKIDKFREKGNSAAHSIEVDITIFQIESTKEDMNYLVSRLVSLRERL
jgi:hypothetical protein